MHLTLAVRCCLELDHMLLTEHFSCVLKAIDVSYPRRVFLLLEVPVSQINNFIVHKSSSEKKSHWKVIDRKVISC